MQSGVISWVDNYPSGILSLSCAPPIKKKTATTHATDLATTFMNSGTTTHLANLNENFIGHRVRLAQADEHMQYIAIIIIILVVIVSVVIP
jgi:hypothetical protein